MGADHDKRVGGVQALHQGWGPKLRIEEVFSLDPDHKGEDKLLFIFPKQNPFFLPQDLNRTVFNEIGEKLGMVLPIDSGHELIDIKGNHIFVVVPVQLTNILCNLLYLSPLLNQININHSILRLENLIIPFVKNALLEKFLLGDCFELFLSGSIHLQKLEKNKNHHLQRIVFRVLTDQMLEGFVNFLLTLEKTIWVVDYLGNLHRIHGEELEEVDRIFNGWSDL